ncbi:hypothetical protein HK097_003017 [Rhizophlyctis rosea]|uniref:Uncharacterized protein n=1 Tax=Rhizophlyctis rosea TaxID=64517 RepID=A0AAD5SMJ1_9FUNG|nr:hypothetical protein HK097_003017 [Rhizophlyctis rosea]
MQPGPASWDRTIGTVFPSVASYVPSFVADTRLNDSTIYAGLLFVGINVATSALNVIKSRKSKKLSTTTPFFGLIPFFVFVAATFSWLYVSPTILKKHIVPFVLLIGCIFGHQVGKMILAHVTHRPFPMFNKSAFFIFTAGIISSFWFRDWTRNPTVETPLRLAAEHFATDFKAQVAQTFSTIGATHVAGRVLSARTTKFLEGLVVYVLLIISVVFYLRFVTKVIGAFCKVFDINCLTIKHKVQEGPVGKVDKVKLKKEM